MAAPQQLRDQRLAHKAGSAGHEDVTRAHRLPHAKPVMDVVAWRLYSEEMGGVNDECRSGAAGNPAAPRFGAFMSAEVSSGGGSPPSGAAQGLGSAERDEALSRARWSL